MKIIIIGPAYPLRGGIAGFNHALTFALQKQGHEVLLVSFTMQYPRILFPGKTQYETRSKPEGLSIVNSINSINWFSWKATAQLVRAHKPDLVIFAYWMPFMCPAYTHIARSLRRVSGLTVLSVMHNVVPHERMPGWKYLLSRFIKQCHGFIALSKAVRDDLTMFDARERSIYVPHPVYSIFGERIDKTQAREKLGLDSQRDYMLFFGMVRQYKGLDLLLQAMGDSRVRALNVCLLVAGEFYEDKAKYQAIIDNLELNSHIVVRDEYIPDNEVALYFSAANLVTQTYHSATQSGVTQIAYHFDRPMLVTDVGGLGEIVPHQNAGYVVPRDPRAIADAIHDYFLHRREEAMSEKVAELKHFFSWEYFTQELEKLVHELNGIVHKTVERSGLI